MSSSPWSSRRSSSDGAGKDIRNPRIPPYLHRRWPPYCRYFGLGARGQMSDRATGARRLDDDILTFTSVPPTGSWGYSKYRIIDDCLAAIGSANLDRRSLHLNYEMTAFFHGGRVAAEFAEVFKRGLTDANEIDPESPAAQPLSRRLIEGAARIPSPLI